MKEQEKSKREKQKRRWNDSTKKQKDKDSSQMKTLPEGIEDWANIRANALKIGNLEKVK